MRSKNTSQLMRHLNCSELQFFKAMNDVTIVTIPIDYQSVESHIYNSWRDEFGRDDQMSDSYEFAAHETSSGHVETIEWPKVWIDIRHDEEAKVLHESLKQIYGPLDDLQQLYELALRT